MTQRANVTVCFVSLPDQSVYLHLTSSSSFLPKCHFTFPFSSGSYRDCKDFQTFTSWNNHPLFYSVHGLSVHYNGLSSCDSDTNCWHTGNEYRSPLTICNIKLGLRDEVISLSQRKCLSFSSVLSVLMRDEEQKQITIFLEKKNKHTHICWHAEVLI